MNVLNWGRDLSVANGTSLLLLLLLLELPQIVSKNAKNRFGWQPNVKNDFVIPDSIFIGEFVSFLIHSFDGISYNTSPSLEKSS